MKSSATGSGGKWRTGGAWNGSQAGLAWSIQMVNQMEAFIESK